MNKSEAITDLAAALAKAQGEMAHAEKSALNPHFGKSYADLASIWDACREPLSKNGLSVVQTMERDEIGLGLVTMLCHSSGQWISGRTYLILTKQDMQGLGSALTYARRYALAAIVGIAQDDDDGNAASGNALTHDNGASPPPKPQTAPPAGMQAPKAETCKCGASMMPSKRNPNEWYCMSCRNTKPRVA